MKPAGKVIDVNFRELEELLERARQALGEGDYQKLAGAVEALRYLIEQIGEKDATIRRLRAVLGKASTEKTRTVLEQAGVEVPPKKDPPPPAREKKAVKGHGRKGAEAYTGAERIPVPHATLKPGDSCPKCLKGKVYRLKDPGLRIRVTGQSPLHAKVYEFEKLRCNLCLECFEAEAPEGVGEEKYDASAAAMIALLRYGSGVPFQRLAGLQANLGIPLPPATQWEIVEETAAVLRPVFEELIRQAAQGEVLYNDDTKMKTLSLARASPEPAEASAETSKSRPRTGQFTSGIVATRQGQKIALFFTGRQHAGENLAKVLAHRAAGLPPPIQMCDAASRNAPKLPQKLEILLGSCSAHARRYFVGVVPNFPEECRFVLESFAEVYKFDAQAEERHLTPQERLRFHQEHSGPVMDRLHAWLQAQFDEKKVEPNSGLGEAITHVLKHWKPLTLFLRQAGAPLDSNIVERALKKCILHRKNSYFYKTPNGAAVGDLFMSLIHTCELNGVNPYDYLIELQRHAQEVAKNPSLWMPWNYRETLTPSARAGTSG